MTNVSPSERARGFASELRERAPEIERQRRLPRELSDRFAEAGFYRMCIPRTLGGLECAPAETMETIETLARSDGASAWCVFIGATSGSVLSQIEDAAARAIFSKPTTLLSGVFAPRGVATAVEGGFRVEGQWAWGSGTQNADWILAGCRIVRDGETERLPDGTPSTRLMIVPAAQVEFLDTWHVSGLAGTGSTDFALRNVFVPEDHCVQFGIDRGSRRPLDAFPRFGLLALGIGAVALGLARASIDALVALAGQKTPTGSGRPLAMRSTAQTEVALAEATLRSARAYYAEAIASAWESAVRDGEITLSQRRDIRLATTHATQASASTVDRMYTLAGGSSVYQSSPLQRIFRDVHVATQHMMVSASTLELTGRMLLGLETDTSQL